MCIRDSFTDAAGNRFEYKVAVVEALTPQSVEDMTSGEWALSLFTCTPVSYTHLDVYKRQEQRIYPQLQRLQRLVTKT